MKCVFGIETEYGITLDGSDSVDVVHESIEIVRSYKEHGASRKWDYQLEDPHQDARGFRARELLQDSDESSYFEIDRRRPLTFEEIKSDLVLGNGARFYNDHAHPEYSTPECSTLAEIVAQDRAGERILSECARIRNARLPKDQKVRLYKNNTDFFGHSYGCHDNYLMSRAVPWDEIVAGTLPFLVTRQIFAGSGKACIESENHEIRPGVYQISQRSDFLSVLVSIDTMNRRPIVNTRDEPHADPEKFRRFHVILGDANLSEFATALKVGTTALVLELIEKGKAPQIELASPVEAAKSISRDESRTWIVELLDGRKISAIDVQRLFLESAYDHCDRDADTDWVLGEWAAILEDLERDFFICRDRLDWVAKLALLEEFRESEGLHWSDPWLQSIDLEYHDISNADGSIYAELEASGRMRRIVTEDQIARAMTQPPPTTRAYFRGQAVSRFSSAIDSLQWDEIIFNGASGAKLVSLAEDVIGPETRRLNKAIREAATLAELRARL
jgi:proteasome accessory factor PafA2